MLLQSYLVQIRVVECRFPALVPGPLNQLLLGWDQESAFCKFHVRDSNTKCKRNQWSRALQFGRLESKSWLCHS